MNSIKAAITALGKFLPEHRLTNAMLEQMVDTNDEWITTRTGIKERRILKEKNLGTSYMAIQAANDLIDKSGLDPKEIDLLIVATATPDMQAAPTAVYTATQIGAVNAFAYDLVAACSSFLYAVSTVSAYIESGRYRKVLLIGADVNSSMIDYTDRATCIIFGDGAAAALFEPNTEGYGFIDEYLRCDGEGRQYLQVPAGGSLMPTSEETLKQRKHFVKQDGKTVFKWAVSNMAEVCQTIVRRNGLNKKNIQWLVAHQANKRIIDATAKHLALDLAKVMMNIHKYGNTTSATIPLLLNDYEKKLKKGDNLIMTAFGGGFTWGSIYLKWAYNKKALHV